MSVIVVSECASGCSSQTYEEMCKLSGQEKSVIHSILDALGLIFFNRRFKVLKMKILTPQQEV